MQIQVKLSTTLRKFVSGYDPEKPLLVELEGPESILNLASKLGLPPAEIKFAMLNGRANSLETLLQDGDRVAFFPPVGGG